MLKPNKDRSIRKAYQEGDLVEVIKGPDKGSWGEVALEGAEDLIKRHTTSVSTVFIKIAGFSKHKADAKIGISGVAVENIRHVTPELKHALAHAVSYDNCSGSTPSVYRILINGSYQYGFNFQRITKSINDRFHYDYGAGINRNTDAEIIWMKEHMV